MANYYTEASFILPLSDEQKPFAEQVIDCACDESIDFTKKHKSKAAKQYDSSVFSVAKKLANAQDDYEPGYFVLGFACQATKEGMWISHDETIDTDQAALFCHLILKHFGSDQYVAIEAAHTCSKARLDAFGGQAVLVTKKSIKWMSTYSWLQDQIAKIKKPVSHSQ